MILNERLAELRKKKDVSRRELSFSLNLEQSTYGKYESGQRQPSLDILQKIADYFNVTTDYLLGKSDVPNPHRDRTETTALEDFLTDNPVSENYIELIRMIDSLPKEKKEIYINFILGFTKLLLDKDGDAQ